MTTRFLQALLVILISLQFAPVAAREGDTLNPIEIEAAPLETYPEGLLADTDYEAIEARTIEARVAGVPLAVRIVDMTQEASELPFPIRKYAQDDFSEPFSEERKAEIANAWGGNETIETSADADDGFLLLVLVPEDRSQTQAIWYTGANALPINGITQQNMLETLGVMNHEFADGNMPNGVYLGISEFSYNVQFGEPERLERSKLGDALHMATIPLSVASAVAGIAVPVLAWWLARRNNFGGGIEQTLTPWHAAALKLKRATPDVTAAMLLDAVHEGAILPGKGGSLQLIEPTANAAVAALRPFANDAGIVPSASMLEVEAITSSVREQLEDELAQSGAMTSDAKIDRSWMLIAIGIALLLASMTAVPTVVGLSAWGAYGIGISLVGIAVGWWWLANRSYTSPAGEKLLAEWLETASTEDRFKFDSAVNMKLFTDQVGGPNVNSQTRIVRQLRGFSAG